MMKKIIRLKESDLTKIVKRVIKEDADEKLALKVERLVDNPQFEEKISQMIDTLSQKEIDHIIGVLESLDIDRFSDAHEVHSTIENNTNTFEMNEDQEKVSDKREAKLKTAEILHALGVANISNWGGIPTALLIGSVTGVPIGIAASWGATALLMLIAKILGKR